MWRVQCQTIKSKVAIHLRKSEKEHGFLLTYNGISRTTFFSSLEYLTMKIKDQSKIND
jgi:hypothetical protein